MIYTFEKDFFIAATFKGLFLLRQSRNVCFILWSVQIFFAFLEDRRTNTYCLWEEKLVFHM